MICSLQTHVSSSILLLPGLLTNGSVSNVFQCVSRLQSETETGS